MKAPGPTWRIPVWSSSWSIWLSRARPELPSKYFLFLPWKISILRSFEYDSKLFLRLEELSETNHYILIPKETLTNTSNGESHLTEFQQKTPSFEMYTILVWRSNDCVVGLGRGTVWFKWISSGLDLEFERNWHPLRPCVRTQSDSNTGWFEAFNLLHVSHAINVGCPWNDPGLPDTHH